MRADSRSVRSLDSISAHAAARARCWRSVDSNCRMRGAVLCCTSMLRASARLTESCHLFLSSVTSYLKESSLRCASLSPTLNFFCKSSNISSRSFFNCSVACWLSSNAATSLWDISFRKSDSAFFNSLISCSSVRLMALCFWDDSLATLNSFSRVDIFSFDFLAALNSFLRSSNWLFNFFSRSPALAIWLSRSSNSSDNSLNSLLTLLSCCSVCPCFWANVAPSSRNCSIIWSLEPPSPVCFIINSSSLSLARWIRLLASSLVSRILFWSVSVSDWNSSCRLDN
mmetsp:Transcript_18529/g.22996  ORF Transcript_18529/g.22996 Transcript_18529/m.22996 type:complete len:284 (-) Transcript_18529:353-1204(-)